MKRFVIPNRLNVMIAVLATFYGLSPAAAFAKSPIRLNKWHGQIDFNAEGTSQFALEGTATHLGKFSAYGEIDLAGAEEGTSAEGIVVFRSANGDLLVGATTWEIGDDSVGSIRFSWRDSVEFSDGTVVESSGRFENAEDRPPGLVVIAIIAILIGMLLPAIQKVR